MLETSNRVAIDILGVLNGAAEGPLAIAAFVAIVFGALILVRQQLGRHQRQ